MNNQICSGLTQFERASGGYLPGRLIVIAGSQMVGKNYFLTSLMTGLAVDHSIPVGMFSLEMPKSLIVRAIACNMYEITHNGQKVGEITDTAEMSERFVNAPVYIDDTPAITLEAIREQIIKFTTDNDVRIIFIDYLQLIKEYRDSPDYLIREIKHIAEETQVTIIVSSTFKTSSQKFFSFDIDYEDTALFKCLMQYADTVAILHRPGFYSSAIAETLPKLSTMRIVKNPGDTPETLDFNYDALICKFTDYRKNEHLNYD